MCVRTLANESDESLIGTRRQRNNKEFRVKEKYVKLHENMIVKDSEVVKEREIIGSKIPHIPRITDDILAIANTVNCAVSWLQKLTKFSQTLQESKIYRILFHTTQPAHIIVIAAALCVTSALFPINERKVHITAGYPRSRATSFIYLASFVMHFGAQVWMTFVSGLSLYFALPRHMFGEVQRVLFPRYFTINACLSLITLLIFVKHHPTDTWDTEIAVQVGGMSGAFFLELLIRLYLTPPLLKLIVQKTALERSAGVGNEIGRHNLGPLKHCPHYHKIHNAFRRVHVYIAAGNILTMVCTLLHLHYIASKLCVL